MSSSARVYSLRQSLSYEDTRKEDVLRVFGANQVEDISSLLAERKSGTDFLLSVEGAEGETRQIRCENKFDRTLTGNLVLEFLSVDRPNLVPGWFFTSRAAWLLTWFESGELVALPMAEVRSLVIKNITHHRATTTDNRRYLTWNILERVTYLVDKVPNARVVDIAPLLGRQVASKRLVSSAALRRKHCTVDELVSLMSTLPSESKPLAISEAQLMRGARLLAPLNFMKTASATMLSRLAWLEVTSEAA